jgi:RHS repeat-associated protein
MFRGLQYQYDPNGRMIWSANLDGSNPGTSVYDGLGQRVQTTQAGVTKRYFYDINGSVVAEYEATGSTGYGALKRLNVSAGGRLLAVDEVQTDGTKITSYAMADRIGSTRALMNTAGAVTSRHDYFPFGEELGAGTGAPGSPTGMRTAAQGYSAADNVRQRYADTRLDDATGLDHTLWRKLETRSGRWTTPDPYGKSLRVANPQSFNRYSYVFNDPVNFVDRNGLNPGDIINGPCPNVGSCNVNVLITFQGASGRGGGSGLGEGFEIVQSLPDETTAGPTTEPEKPLEKEQKAATRAAKLLENTDCSNFMAELISIASYLVGITNGQLTPMFTPLTAPSANNQIPSFGANYAPGEYEAALAAGRVAPSGRTVRNGDTITFGQTTGNNIITWNKDFYDLGLDDQALQTLHESMHLIPNFSDAVIAGAASIMATRGVGNPGNTGSFRDISHESQYINEQISKHCKPK